jgi:hypothetical protein
MPTWPLASLPCVLQVFTTSVAVAGDIQVALVVQTMTTTTTTTGGAPASSTTSSSNISSSHEERVACAMSGTLTMTSREYPGPGLSGEG